MNIKEHYSINSRKSLKPYLKLAILFIMFFTISNSYARYTFVTSDNAIITVAKWNIQINGELITSSTNELNGNIQLYNLSDNSTKIDSGDECYFDVIINPSTTEVAISYSIEINLEESNLPSGTQITKYEMFSGSAENEKKDKENNVGQNYLIVSENVLLPEEKTELDETSIRRYRIYCKIPFPIDVEKDAQYIVRPRITVEQYIE